MNLEKLRAHFGGTLLQPGGDGYDAARRLYNGMIDKRPALIARCSGVSDVMRAVDFGRENAMLTAVRGGGHNVTGNASCDGGLMIDLSPMKGVRVDPARRIAHAQAGITLGGFDRECQAFGLATTGGVVSTTGLAGLTLGGGLGWLMRKHGLACDNLVSADVVTADGRFVTASAGENADLFWGLRGGGGNFGVVTSFEFRLHEVGPILGGMILYPVEKGREALRFYRDFVHNAPDELTTFAGFLYSPDGVPFAASVVGYCGDIAAGERVLKPLRDFGAPAADLVAPKSYCEHQSMLDEGFPAGIHNYWKAAFLGPLRDEAIDLLADAFTRVPTPLCALVIEQLGGAVSRVAAEETAFTLRDGEFNLAIIGRWTEPAHAEPVTRWVRDVWNSMQPYATQTAYVNYMAADEGEDRIRAVYGKSYDRLAAVKKKYDPANFFRLNQNIRPAA